MVAEGRELKLESGEQRLPLSPVHGKTEEGHIDKADSVPPVVERGESARIKVVALRMY